MIRAGAGCANAANPRAAALEATAAALAQAGLRVAAGALCFVSSAYGGAFPLILRAVAEAAGTREVAGCGALGVIANGREFESGRSLAVMVFGDDEITARRLFAPQARGRARAIATEIAAAARPHLGPNNLLCLFPDSYNLEAEPFLDALADALPGVAIVGGGATEDGTVGETFQFCGDVVSSNAVAGMLLSGEFDVAIGAANACAPLGRLHRVTAARDNVILALDGRPAWDVFAESAGPLAADLPRAIAFVFAAIPLDPADERLERNAFVVRNVVGASPEHGAVAIAHRPRVGDRIGFALRDGERARAELKAELERLGAAASFAPPAFGLYFDCVSRGAGLYGLPDHDSAYIGRQFPNLPLAGFFTGFEIGPIGQRTGLLQYCGVLALLAPRAKH